MSEKMDKILSRIFWEHLSTCLICQRFGIVQTESNVGFYVKNDHRGIKIQICSFQIRDVSPPDVVLASSAIKIQRAKNQRMIINS